jgi:hypothetical protein
LAILAFRLAPLITHSDSLTGMGAVLREVLECRLDVKVVPIEKAEDLRGVCLVLKKKKRNEENLTEARAS